MGSDNATKNADEEIKANPALLLMFTIIPLSIGTFIATAVFSLGKTDTYVRLIKDAAVEDMHWIHLAVVILGRLIAYVNMRPICYKKGVEGNLRSNPFIYKVVCNDGTSENQVLFDSDGKHGKYNRGNRSLQHMLENIGAMIAGIAVVGSIFPFPAFVLVCIFAVGRILHQEGYIVGYGKHGLGFVISTIASVTVEGLAFIVFLKGSGLISV